MNIRYYQELHPLADDTFRARRDCGHPLRHGFDKKIEYYFTIFIIMLSVSLFGSIETWAFALVGTATVIIFNIWLYRYHGQLRIPEALWQRILLISIICFLSACIFQIIPLPALLIKTLSSSKYNLLKDISSGSFLSISFYPYETLNETVKIIIYFMIFAMMAFPAKDREFIRRVMLALVVFGFILSIFAVIQKATWNGKIYWFREIPRNGSPFGPFVNKNHFSGFIGMIIPLGLGLALESKKAEKAILLSFLSLVMAVGLFVSASRGGILCFLISTAFFFFIALRKRSILYLSVFLLALLLNLSYLETAPVMETAERFAAISFDGKRTLVWYGTLKAFAEHLWFGTGLGTFRYIFPVYYPAGLQGNFHYAHNDYLQLMLETGIAGTLFIALFLMSIFLAITKYTRINRMPSTLAGLIASMLYMLIHSFFDFNLHMPSNAITFFAILGLIVSYVSGTAEKTNDFRRQNYPDDVSCTE